MIVNKHAGKCLQCGNRVPAKGGYLTKVGGRFAVVHNACERGASVVGITLNSGAVLSVNRNGRCEDAPCCGCCT